MTTVINHSLNMQSLTRRQSEVLELIKNHIAEFGIPPTRADIARLMGFKSSNSAETHLQAIAKKGYIDIKARTSRGIKLTEEGTHEVNLGLPLLGRVAAGEPILAIEHAEEHLKIDPNMFSPFADFLLRVSGDSMKDIGMLEGDLLAVHKTTLVSYGQIVIALIDDEVTVKRFEKKGDKVYLHGENKAYSPIVVDLKTQALNIEGLVVGVIRNRGW